MESEEVCDVPSELIALHTLGIITVSHDKHADHEGKHMSVEASCVSGVAQGQSVGRGRARDTFHVNRPFAAPRSQHIHDPMS